MTTQISLGGGMWYRVARVESRNNTHITLTAYSPSAKGGLVRSGYVIRKMDGIRSGAKPLYAPSLEELLRIERFTGKRKV